MERLLLENTVDKFAWQLRAFRAAAWPLILLFTACTPTDEDPSVCVGGNCEATMIFPTAADENGYYHVKLDWTKDYLPYFAVTVEASDVDPVYLYNGVPAVEAEFDTDKYWTLGDDIVFTVPIYNLLQSNYSTPGVPLPIGTSQLELKQFSGMTLNLVQNYTRIYLNSRKNNKLYSTRIVGPIPPVFIGDTVTVKMDVFWDAGSKSIFKNNIIEKFIVE